MAIHVSAWELITEQIPADDLDESFKAAARSMQIGAPLTAAHVFAAYENIARERKLARPKEIVVYDRHGNRYVYDDCHNLLSTSLNPKLTGAINND